MYLYKYFNVQSSPNLWTGVYNNNAKWKIIVRGPWMFMPFCDGDSFQNLRTGGLLSMYIYLCLCRRGRQIDSSRSGPIVTAKPLWWMAEAAGWTGPLLQWGSWVSPSWCAGPHRMMSACSPSACHKGQRWRRPLLNTENRLMQGGRKSREWGVGKKDREKWGLMEKS